MIIKLFLDSDGTLADFDKHAKKIFGMEPREFESINGSKRFWEIIRETENFFYDLEPMQDAFDLVNAVRHLNPVILTGIPRGIWAIDQKLNWGKKHFPDLEMICCPSIDKIKHASPGDILIDDWEKHKQKWIDGGGIWITHISAENSINELKKLNVL